MYSPFLASSRLVPCFLCQKGADTKLLPCGHVIMCSDCAGRAKRCPDCRVGPIFNLVLLLPAVNTLYLILMNCFYVYCRQWCNHLQQHVCYATRSKFHTPSHLAVTTTVQVSIYMLMTSKLNVSTSFMNISTGIVLQFKHDSHSFPIQIVVLKSQAVLPARCSVELKKKLPRVVFS